MSTAYALAWARAFALTQAVEIPVYRRLTRCSVWRAALASAITHPILWFVLVPLSPWTYGVTIAVSEGWAVVVEAAVLRGARTPPARWRDALGWSLLANGASLIVGMCTRAFTGYP